MGRSFLKRIIKRKVSDGVISLKASKALRWIKLPRKVALIRENVGAV